MKELSKKFNKIIKNAKSLEKGETVDFKDLFSRKFMTTNTSYSDIYDFLNIKFKVETQEDFNNINQEELDLFVKENSKFNSWDEMISEASAEYTFKKLFD